MPPLFLDISHVLRTHLSLIERYGGAEGVRDAGLLHSAVAMPQASFGGEFLHKNLFEMAAAGGNAHPTAPDLESTGNSMLIRRVTDAVERSPPIVQ